MGGRGSGSAGGMQIARFGNILPNAQAAAAANNAAFPSSDPNGFHDLYNGRQYFNAQNLSIDQQLAVTNYLSNTQEPGSLYSMSQNMNYALANGQKLNANQQYTYDNMMSAMHNMGYNTNLTRYDHPAMVNNLLKQAGVTKTYDQMSDAQLKAALKDMTYGEHKLVSTSYNDFKNAPNATTFTSRAVKINYKTTAGAQAMMPGNGPAGALGEVVLADSLNRKNYKILDVRLTGQMARRQGTQRYDMPRLELDVLVT